MANDSRQYKVSKRIDRFVDWFIGSRYMESRQFGSSSDMWIEDPERAERCELAAQDGADGSTHGEIIDDWREAFRDWVRYDARRGRRHGEYPERFAAAVEEYFDQVEAWHEQHGSLDQQVG